MVSDTIQRDITIAAPVDKVWAALTEDKHIKEWFGDDAEVDLRPGGAIVFGWDAHGRFRGKVETVEPPHRFSYWWARPADTEPAPGNQTLVEFTLSEDGGGTRLRVVESGFTTLDRDQEQSHKDNTEGWRIELDELRTYVEA
ncbi:SRPBCC family protein [Kibdelosporangium philippinense]|uniref:SRPBCC family protein n=1 Tax=Kibdelosporangium philippinense TaxID=211113 RepID=A0ABS8Z8B5_9PSEU|nr:SRPBCC family protein [Kibdelosporangium philippinense]MCE7002808.1 SRPBCC family protein [Kibdelosporangium philippinense]